MQFIVTAYDGADEKALERRSGLLPPSGFMIFGIRQPNGEKKISTKLKEC